MCSTFSTFDMLTEIYNIHTIPFADKLHGFPLFCVVKSSVACKRIIGWVNILNGPHSDRFNEHHVFAQTHCNEVVACFLLLLLHSRHVSTNTIHPPTKRAPNTLITAISTVSPFPNDDDGDDDDGDGDDDDKGNTELVPEGGRLHTTFLFAHSDRVQ